jgi:diguanylate cyclase (GGDEF)-like protein
LFEDEARLVGQVADPLTGLATRADFIASLQQLFAAGAPLDGAVLAILINLHDFRNVNTVYGAATGDQVLQVTAERLLSGTRSRTLPGEATEVRGPDLVARLGGDEFAMLLGAPPPAIEAEALAARLLRAVEGPIVLDGNSLRLAARAGVVVITGAARHGPDDVLRDLAIAAQRAKALGPGTVALWRPSLTAAATRRATLAMQLRRAFDNGEFVVHYQPVLRLNDARLVGAEGLLRWNNPSEGLVNCTAFMPVLEEAGLIVELGNWVLRETVRQIERWDALYGRDIVDWVGVNLSPLQVHHPERLVATLRAIDAGGFSLRRLCLEIPAAAFARGSDRGDDILGELRKLRQRIAIADFGTGHVWPDGQLRHPVDAVKIDGEFTAGIGTAQGETLLQALFAIGRLYETAIIAEGIETPAQCDFLRRIGCGFGQGYVFAEPMDVALFGTYALTHAVENGAGARLTG